MTRRRSRPESTPFFTAADGYCARRERYAQIDGASGHGMRIFPATCSMRISRSSSTCAARAVQVLGRHANGFHGKEPINHSRQCSSFSKKTCVGLEQRYLANYSLCCSGGVRYTLLNVAVLGGTRQLFVDSLHFASLGGRLGCILFTFLDEARLRCAR